MASVLWTWNSLEQLGRLFLRHWENQGRKTRPPDLCPPGAIPQVAYVAGPPSAQRDLGRVRSCRCASLTKIVLAVFEKTASKEGRPTRPAPTQAPLTAHTRGEWRGGGKKFGVPFAFFFFFFFFFFKSRDRWMQHIHTCNELLVHSLCINGKPTNVAFAPFIIKLLASGDRKLGFPGTSCHGDSSH